LDYVIHKEGFIRKDISHEVKGFELETEIYMAENESKIKGKTCDKAGNPVVNASVSFSIGGSTIDRKSDKDGSFSFTAGRQFLNKSIGYEASKEGFKVKSGRLELIEDLKCINLDPIPEPFWKKNKNKVAVALIAMIGLAIVAYLILQDEPELVIYPYP